MSECPVCHGKRLREELVDKVFNAGDRYVLVAGMPSTVCQDCGERSFSREATERARRCAVMAGAATRSTTLRAVRIF